MIELRLLISGSGETQQAADALEAALGGGVTVAPAPNPSLDGQRGVDPVAIAALVLSIPSAMLAVADLVDRVRSRKRAAEIIEFAGRLSVEHRVEIHVMADDGPQPLAGLTPDRMLDMANPGEPKL